MNINKGKIVYLDNASATPIDPYVQKVMHKILKYDFANPNGIHTDSIQVRSLIEGARDTIARALSAHKNEIIFTGSGTESDALAILGLVYEYHQHHFDKLPNIITTNIEHSAVLENCKMLEQKGLATVTYIQVESNGIIDPKKIAEALKPNTILVSVMYANNEIGTTQPIQEIAKAIRRFRKNKKQNKYFTDKPFFHTDACQAMNYLFTENIEKLGVDMLTFNGSKIYGPKGVGVLYKKRNVQLGPVYGGGGQEYGLRPGTEDTLRIVSIAKSLEIVNKIKNKEVSRLKKLQNYFFDKIKNLEDTTGYKIHINGDRLERLPNNINISIAGISSELLVIELDANGFAVSSKSACKSTEEESSHVVHAIRLADDKFESEESLRITMGRDTTKKDIQKLIQVLKGILLKYREWK